MRLLLAVAIVAIYASPATAAKRTGAVACNDLAVAVQISKAPDAAARAQMVANEVKSGSCRVYRNTACLIPGENRLGFSCMRSGRAAESCQWINVDAALDHSGGGRDCS